MRKKSGKKAANLFKEELAEIRAFVSEISEQDLSDSHITWVYDYAVIRLYRAFEHLILNCLVAAINNDTAQLSRATNVNFPKHLTDEVCEYLIVGHGYFDFRGREGLIQTLKKFLPEDHYLTTVVKKATYKEALEQLAALRNFAAHGSQAAKRRAAAAIGAKRLSASGAWLKRQDRFEIIAAKLESLAGEIESHAPY